MNFFSLLHILTFQVRFSGNDVKGRLTVPRISRSDFWLRHVSLQGVTQDRTSKVSSEEITGLSNLETKVL